jgi:protoporphyrin/coproporphyrin ferrochelatase
VVEIPRLAWLPILHGIILRTRPRKSAAKYKSVWMPEGSPLAVWTARQATALNQALNAGAVPGQEPFLVRHAMRYGQPSVGSVLDALRAEGAVRVLVLPLYPQYAGATTGSVSDAVGAWARQVRFVPDLRTVSAWHDDPGYIDALAQSLQRHWQQNGRAERVLLSFHGLPARSLALGDPYHCHCYKTARLLGERLGLPPGTLHVSFQSRFGKAKWLEPYTEPTLRQWAAEGVKSVDVACPGFAGDCLETLEEIALEAREAFLHSGGKEFRYVPCLNDDAAFIQALALLARQHMQGWPGVGSVSATAPMGTEELAGQRVAALALGASQ